jgi:hypothetical protein
VDESENEGRGLGTAAVSWLPGLTTKSALL